MPALLSPDKGTNEAVKLPDNMQLQQGTWMHCYRQHSMHPIHVLHMQMQGLMIIFLGLHEGMTCQQTPHE